MPKVFISHSSKDADFVEKELLPFLRQNGIDAWYSTDAIHSTDEWIRKIRDGLDACDWFLIVLTPNSIVSKWVQAELHWALENRTGRIIPLLVSACNVADLHLQLPLIQHIDLRSKGEAAWNRLAATWGVAQPIKPPPPLNDKTLVVDMDDAGFELDSLETKEIEFVAGDVRLCLPVSKISQVERTAKGNYMLRTVGGEQFAGTVSGEMKGQWDLGSFSAHLSDLKSIAFGQAKAGSDPEPIGPRGFVAQCTSCKDFSAEVSQLALIYGPYWNPQGHPARTFLLLEHEGAQVSLPFADVDRVLFHENSCATPAEEKRGPMVTLETRTKGKIVSRLASWHIDWFQYTCFIGTWKYGKTSMDCWNLREIVFDHKKSSGPRTGLRDEIRIAESPLDVEVIKRDGKRVLLKSAYLWKGSYDGASTSFDFFISSSRSVVELNRIQRMEFAPWELSSSQHPKAKLITRGSGKTHDVQVHNGSSSRLVGNLADWGLAQIWLPDVASVEILNPGG